MSRSGKGRRESLRIALLSDTHELHREVEVPPCDLLVHAGDFTMFSRSAAAVEDFDEWLGELPCRHRVVVPGNHDSCLEPNRAAVVRLQNAQVLINEAIIIEGLRIWGSPATPLLNGAFALPGLRARQELYASIPADTDVLVTHGPPLRILDRSPGSPEHQGCPALLDAVERTQPLIHCFGHVHGAYGMRQSDSTTFVNAALLGPDGDIAHTPVVVDLPRR